MEIREVPRVNYVIDRYVAEILTDRLRRQMNGEEVFEPINYYNNSTAIE